jgi:hypothetical protein
LATRRKFTRRGRMLPLLLIPIALLAAVPAYSQTFCNKIGNSVVCSGENGSSRTYTPSGRNSGVITDERGNLSFYNNGVIIDAESQSFRETQRRSEERRREMIYGDDRRDDSGSRYRDEER